jgi:uncharacterized membrane protein YfcA
LSIETVDFDRFGASLLELFLVALAGFVASMVDGALGMGFGPTSSTILLSSGVSPAAVSTTVNLAKVATGAAAGIAHWKFRNIDHRLVLKLALPGSAGALVGVTVLTNVDGDQLKPILAVLLIVVGLRILLRFSRPLPTARTNPDATDATDTTDTAKATEATEAADVTDAAVAGDTMPPFDERGVTAAAAAGGVTNGLVGAWGPVVTPFLLHKGLPPRFAIGSVNTAEVAVATVSAGSLIASLGGEGIDVKIVIAMLLGGALAAPLAAMVIRRLPARALGVAVGGLLLSTNVRELSGWGDLGIERWACYGLVIAFVTLAALRPRFMRPAPVELADASRVA